MAEIKLIIEMDGQQTVVNITDKVGDSLKKMGGATEETDKKVTNLRTTFKSLIASGRDLNQSLELIKKGFRAIKIGLEFARAGAIFQEQTFALDALAKKYGTTAQSIVEDTRLASGGMASMRDATKQAARAITLGLKPDDVVKFAKIARASAKAMGTDFSAMFESITTGVARQSKLWLDNLGILINVEEANRRYADSLGITASQLTEVQRRQAFTNEALRQGEVIVNNMADVMDTTADKFREAAAAYDDFVLSLQEGAAQDIEQTKILEGGTAVLQFLAEWQNEANEFKKILGDVNAVAGKSMIGLIESASDSRKELETLRETLRGLSRGELVELSAFAALSGNTVTDLAGRIDLAIQASDNSAKSWQTLTSRIFKNVEALGAARKFINKVRAAAGPGMDFIMRIRTRLSGVASAILSWLGIVPAGATDDAGGGGTGEGGTGKTPAEIFNELENSIERIAGRLEKQDPFLKVFNQLEDIRTLANDLNDVQREWIDELVADAQQLLKEKTFNDLIVNRRKVFQGILDDQKERTQLLNEEISRIEKSLQIQIEFLEVSEEQQAIIEELQQDGLSAINILEQQIVLEERKIELARLDNELAGKGVLNDLTQLQILENTIELRKTEIEIAKQRAELAEKEEQARVEARFGQAGFGGGEITLGGFGGAGGTEAEQLQLTEDEKFQVLNMAFVREAELRMAQLALVEDINQRMVEGGKRAALALVAGGFEVIGRGLGDMIAGTKQGSQEFGKAMKALVGEAAGQFGSFLIAQGVGNVALSIFPPNPIAATAGIAQIVAGTALVALGRAAAASAQGQPSQAAGGAGAAPGGRAGGVPPAPIPAEAAGGGTFVINITATGDIVDLPAFVEEKISPVLAKSIGAGNLGSAEFNLRAIRE